MKLLLFFEHFIDENENSMIHFVFQIQKRQPPERVCVGLRQKNTTTAQTQRH